MTAMWFVMGILQFRTRLWLTNTHKSEVKSVIAALKKGHDHRAILSLQPKATEQCSVNYLVQQGMVGLYDAPFDDLFKVGDKVV